LQGSAPEEIILAEEEAVINRGVGITQQVESDFDLGPQTEGNLVLTNRRLVYAHGAQHEMDIPVGTVDPFETLGRKRLYISDVEDLDDIPHDSSNITIQISAVTSARGHHAPGLSPRLEVRWNDGGVVKVTEFVEQETGRSRRRNLNDWAPVIERLKAGKQKLLLLPRAPQRDSLEGQVLVELADMQEKGLLTIGQGIEKKHGVSLDPEDVREACENLASQGLVERITPPQEDPFYVKVSPLGGDDLNQ